MTSVWESPVILDMALLLSSAVKILSVTAFPTAYLRIAGSKPYHPTDEERNEQRSQDQRGRIAFARDLQILLGPGKLLAGLRQSRLQLLPAGFDLLLHAAEVMRPAAQLALQTKSERVDLSFGHDAGFGRNASGGI